ncbi:sensor histidine kinase [Enterococcus sp. BWB1-3]|uniref:sensor histidine kinase n=1 Tax=Enterococcus sp. BWB1-3 TaxID=2787713 RepID=UPI001920EFA2|nr:histidine kinase [Enterococcus sp. BWB1-3]MBL1229670.1 sensor histidine kinase [Enterococcus sp. BWB1-3]
MRKDKIYVLEQGLFLMIGILLSMQEHFQPQLIIYPLTAVIFCGAGYLLVPEKNRWLLPIFFAGLGVRWPLLLFYLPLILRIFGSKQWKQPSVQFLAAAFIMYLSGSLSLSYRSIVLVVSLAAQLGCWNQQRYRRLEKQFRLLKDDSWENQQQLENKNKLLQENQESLIELEILQERNRIARDIHDNVGHLLSSAIIQLGAIEALNQQENLMKPVQLLKETVHQGMDNIRESVHDLHQETLPLDMAVDLMVNEFRFCPVEIKGTFLEQLSAQENKVLIMVIKEALSNVMKHSHASKVVIGFTEMPAFYRCKISNDCSKKVEYDPTEAGIGITGMHQRVRGIGGQLHVKASKNEFLLTVILPKGGRI